jgi:methyl-accepting chemotaxis protein
MRFLSRLKLWQKLALIVGALLIPTALASAFYIRTMSGATDVSRLEIAGARYLLPLGVLRLELLAHRGLASGVRNGDASRLPEIERSEREINSLVGDIGEVDAEFNVLFETSAQWRQFTQDWSSLQSRWQEMAPAEVLEQHERLLDQVAQLNMKVWMDSTLSLDPEATAYYLIIAATDKIPAVANRLGQIRMIGAGAARAGTFAPTDAVAIHLNEELIATDLRTMTTELRSVAAGAPVVRETILPALTEVESRYASFSAKIDAQPGSQVAAANDGSVDRDGGTVNDSIHALSAATYSAVMDELTQRLASQRQSLYVNIAAVAVLLTIALMLGALVSRALTRQMAKAVSVFGSIATGSYDNEIHPDGTDEVAQVLRALSQMQDKLRKLKEDEADAAATVSGRIRAALDHATSSMVVADSDLKIIYVNHAFESMMKAAESDIRGSLPGFSVTALIDSDIGVLFANATTVREEIRTLNTAFTRDFALGSRSFRLHANPVVSSSGERIGTVLEWTDRTLQAATENEMQEMLKAVLAGQLDRRIRLEGTNGFLATMSNGVNALVNNMADIIAKVQHATAGVYRGAREIASGNANLSERTEEQSSSLAQTASSMEQMLSTVKQNAENAGHANQLAITARNEAAKGGAVVEQAVRAMHEINQSSKKIADIIGVIDEIAFQTNLLALNAAVEAARAGEQGRGFAVVASEVRGLAGRSAKAAREIKGLIHESLEKVEDGSELVSRSGQSLQEIVASVNKVSDIVAEIAAASRDQSVGIEQVNRAVSKMESITQQNSSLVEQATASSRQMSDEAALLDELMARYRVDTNKAAGPDVTGREAA